MDGNGVNIIVFGRCCLKLVNILGGLGFGIPLAVALGKNQHRLAPGLTASFVSCMEATGCAHASA
jgi:hypothetical protein